MKYLFGFILLFLIGCNKPTTEEDFPRPYPIDCDCGYLTNVWIIDNIKYMERQNDCTGNLDTLVWNLVIPLDWDVGSYLCDLKEIDPDSLNCHNP